MKTKLGQQIYIVRTLADRLKFQDAVSNREIVPEDHQTAAVADGPFRAMRLGNEGYFLFAVHPDDIVATFGERHITAGDLRDHFRGLAIAECLGLRLIRRGEDSGRYATSWGSKTPCGLWRTLVAQCGKPTF